MSTSSQPPESETSSTGRTSSTGSTLVPVLGPLNFQRLSREELIEVRKMYQEELKEIDKEFHLRQVALIRDKVVRVLQNPAQNFTIDESGRSSGLVRIWVEIPKSQWEAM